MKSLSTKMLDEVYRIYADKIGEVLDLGEDPETGSRVELEVLSVKRREGGVIVKFTNNARTSFSEREFTLNRSV